MLSSQKNVVRQTKRPRSDVDSNDKNVSSSGACGTQICASSTLRSSAPTTPRVVTNTIGGCHPSSLSGQSCSDNAKTCNPLSEIRREVFPPSQEGKNVKVARLGGSALSFLDTIRQFDPQILAGVKDTTISELLGRMEWIKAEISRHRGFRTLGSNEGERQQHRNSWHAADQDKENQPRNLNLPKSKSQPLQKMVSQHRQLPPTHDQLIERNACLKCRKENMVQRHKDCCCRYHKIKWSYLVCDDCHGDEYKGTCDYCEQKICIYSQACHGKNCKNVLCSWCLHRYEHSWEDCKYKCAIFCRDCKDDAFENYCGVCANPLCKTCDFDRCRWCTRPICNNYETCKAKIESTSNVDYETSPGGTFLEEDGGNRRGPGVCITCQRRAEEDGYFHAPILM